MAKKDSYEASIDEVETILEKLESKEISMDNLLANVKRASELIQGCQDKLRDIEVDLEKIVSKK